MKKKAALFLLITLITSCRKKLPDFDMCVTLENNSFYCVNQSSPSTEGGYEKPYSPGMICMESRSFNIIIDEISKRDAEIARYKFSPSN